MSIRDWLTIRYLSAQIAYKKIMLRIDNWRIARKEKELEQIERELALAEWREAKEGDDD